MAAELVCDEDGAELTRSLPEGAGDETDADSFTAELSVDENEAGFTLYPPKDTGAVGDEDAGGVATDILAEEGRGLTL